jgi:hypothetical protein
MKQCDLKPWQHDMEHSIRQSLEDNLGDTIVIVMAPRPGLLMVRISCTDHSANLNIGCIDAANLSDTLERIARGS